MTSKKKTNMKTKTKKKPLKIKEEDFFFNSSGGMMMTEEEEEEEENNRILILGNDEEEKNYETGGMNLKEILTQRLEGEGRNGYVLTRFFLESRGVSIRSTSSQTSLQ